MPTPTQDECRNEQGVTINLPIDLGSLLNLRTRVHFLITGVQNTIHAAFILSYLLLVTKMASVVELDV